MGKPNTNGKNGQDEKGRFVAGNKVAEGHTNPRALHVQKLRAALEKAVSEKDLQQIVAALKRKAKKGDTHAADILFDRIFGKPIQQHELGQDTMETLAAFLGKL